MPTVTMAGAVRTTPPDTHPDTHPAGSSRVVATRDAWQALVRLHAGRGPVVLVEVGRRGPGDTRLECVAERDFTIATSDRHAGTVDRCPVYVDADADDGAHRPLYLLDLTPGAAPEATLAPDAGRQFVVRRLGGV